MAVADDSARERGADDRGEDILVVDDDPANLLAIEAALGELGRGLVKVKSGAEALRRLLEQRFALVLLDVYMPDMTGYETARLIRARPSTRNLPIIFITAARPDSAEILQGYALGAVDFLFKPIVPEVLRAKASVFVELRRQADEVARHAAMLAEHQRREHERRLETERQRWEAESLRRRMEQERREALESSRRAEELARTVSELERAETELKRINARLAEADRRKDEFLAMLGHELRNPLAPIVNGLEILRHARLEDPKTAKARDAMARQMGHLQRLVDDLLDVSRITSGTIELRLDAVRLSRIVEQAVAMSRPHIEERRHRLHLRGGSDANIHGDAVRLTQVVANLLNNAARYTDVEGSIEVAWSQEEGEAVVRVTDDGRGIAPDRLSTIFDMFVRDATEGGGLGLGLTLVDRIVELHGGRVRVHSEGVDRGSCFEVRLPVANVADATPPEDAAAVRANGEVEAGLDIALIEDNDDIRETVQLLLEHWGHRVRAVDNGADGIELVLHMRPDVAIVDIGLPVFDGYAVASRVRAELGTAKPKMIAMTGFGQRADRRRSLIAGFDAHLVKPVEPARLRQLLCEHDRNSKEERHADSVRDSHQV